ncbi:MAG TPA: hypothetical protein VKB43_09440 [Gaiellaceae bacterium]|nr:hypothetical protein [Gaiellaceae bacterium]
MDGGGGVGFAISDAAEAIIRDRGGELWIWAGDDGTACAELTRSALPLRPLGEDHAGGGELG